MLITATDFYQDKSCCKCIKHNQISVRVVLRYGCCNLLSEAQQGASRTRGVRSKQSSRHKRNRRSRSNGKLDGERKKRRRQKRRGKLARAAAPLEAAERRGGGGSNPSGVLRSWECPRPSYIEAVEVGQDFGWAFRPMGL